MNRDYLKQIVLDQSEMYLVEPAVRRNIELEENINYCLFFSFLLSSHLLHMQFPED